MIEQCPEGSRYLEKEDMPLVLWWCSLDVALYVKNQLYPWSLLNDFLVPVCQLYSDLNWLLQAAGCMHMLRW